MSLEIREGTDCASIATSLKTSYSHYEPLVVFEAPNINPEVSARLKEEINKIQEKITQ